MCSSCCVQIWFPTHQFVFDSCRLTGCPHCSSEGGRRRKGEMFLPFPALVHCKIQFVILACWQVDLDQIAACETARKALEEACGPLKSKKSKKA